jgi:adenylate cyclase class IV
MSHNIEIKARVDNMCALVARVSKIADHGPVIIAQEDTFFNCAAGRLKLRKLGPDNGQLIFYNRPDQAGPGLSFFLCSATPDPALMEQSLQLAYGVFGRVIKQRTLYRVGRTRVHLDRVHDLGDFMELEVVMGKDDSAEDGIAEADLLMEKLGIEELQLVEGAYIDLLESQRRQRAVKPSTSS